MCTHMLGRCGCTGAVHMSASTYGGLKRAMVSLELETAGAHLTWVLPNEGSFSSLQGK